jgi:hypothetical protein
MTGDSILFDVSWHDGTSVAILLNGLCVCALFSSSDAKAVVENSRESQ